LASFKSKLKLTMMKKIYLLPALLLFVFFAQGQRKGAPVELKHAKSALSFPRSGLASNCDILNYPVPKSWDTLRIYVYDYVEPLDTGFITGTNSYGDLQKAQYFDASGKSDTYLTEVWVGFGVAYSSNPNKQVPIRVYDGTSGSPGSLIGSYNVKIGDIADDVAVNNYTDVVFSPALALPASKKFFVSVDLTNLNWDASPADSLAIWSSTGDSATGAWERVRTPTGSAWGLFPDIEGFDVALDIHPFLSANQTCTVLPVHLLSFNAQAKGKNAVLDWKVTQETDLRNT
jgi:serine protease